VASAKRILVIDDENHLRRTLTVILQRAGYQVIAATCGRDAHDYLKDMKFDLVFLDINLTDINGLTLLPKIKTTYPGLPVIILTAYPSQESMSYARHEGASEYLLKPVDPECLLEAVVRVLGSSEWV
jgi:DNA-binding NtrC family response regulator